PTGDPIEDRRVGVRLVGLDGGMEDVHPRTLQPLEIAGAKAAGLALPGVELRPVEGEEAEHVDDGRPPDQLDGAGGILHPLVGEEAVASPVDEGSGEDACTGEGSRPQELTAIQLIPSLKSGMDCTGCSPAWLWGCRKVLKGIRCRRCLLFSVA